MKSNELIWKTRDGREVMIKDMDDSHLINTIRYLQRTSSVSKASRENAMMNYLSDAPEHAADAADYELDRLMELSLEEFLQSDRRYAAMVKEAKRRKLKYEDNFPDEDTAARQAFAVMFPKMVDAPFPTLP